LNSAEIEDMEKTLSHVNLGPTVSSPSSANSRMAFCWRAFPCCTRRKVWDLEAGQETLALRGHESSVLSLAMSSGGKRLISGSGAFQKPGGIKVWDLGAGK
jgi:WD40 repeat protein